MDLFKKYISGRYASQLGGIKVVEKRFLLFAVFEEGQIVVQGKLLAPGRPRVELAHVKQLPTYNTALILCNSFKVH